MGQLSSNYMHLACYNGERKSHFYNPVVGQKAKN
ncbi:hypothetical protein D918_04604 [Trichuris suis]|nr:hypothetical protein D918_04604 [Trichuris suis]